MQLVESKASLSKNFHISPSEIDTMPMWEYELYIKALNDMIKEENKKNKKEQDKYNIDGYKKYSDPNRIMKSSNFKPPSMPSINLK